MTSLVWLIPGLPLIGFTFLLLFGKRLGEPQAGWLATAAVSGSFLSAVAVFFGLATKPPEERVYEITLFEWIPSGELSVGLGFFSLTPYQLLWLYL